MTLIYTPFKSGSCTLYSYLLNNNITTGKWLKSDVQLDPNKPNIIIKQHSDVYNIHEIIQEHMPEFKPKIIFTIIRDPREIYISAFFQDMDKPSYPYYYDNADNIMNTDINLLIKHYYKFRWSDYQHLNTHTCIKTLEEYTNIDIYGQSFDKINKYKIYKTNDITLCILNIKILHNKLIIKQILKELNYDDEIINNIDTASQSNISSDKWYAEKYEEFKNNIVKPNLFGDESLIYEQFL